MRLIYSVDLSMKNGGVLGWSEVLVVIIKLFFFNGIFIKSAFAQTSCEIKNGQCTYNVNLNTMGICLPSSTETANNFKIDENLVQQNGKMTEMQKDFNVVKSEHELRIKELEESVVKLLRNAVPEQHNTRSREVYIERVADERSQPRDENGNILLFQLQHQFNTLRKSLSERTADLLETRNKLNETTDLLNAAQKQAMDANSKLVTYETQTSVLRRENRILKNQLKHKSDRLELMDDKFSATESNLLKLENQLYDIVRSESTLREELATVRMKLNLTLDEVDELKQNYSNLDALYKKTEKSLREREADLQDCFEGKTQTFCGFEDPQLCGFKQDNATDDFDWELHQGRSPSSNTGPENDHTCKSKDGHYMYIEASGKSKSQTAKLYTPSYRGLNPQCIEFYYHMHGRQIGTLTVYSKELTSDEFQAVWRVFGNQGNLWIKASVSVDEETARSGYKLIFEGQTEGGYEGDISIDDFVIRDGRCDGDTASREIQPPSMTDPEKKKLLDNQIERYRKILRRRQRIRNERGRASS